MRGQVVLLAAVLFSTSLSSVFPIQAVLLHLFLFFSCAMICHGRLAQIAPHPIHLTKYYLWISIGGVAGGLFNAILAPSLFSGSVEYWIVLGLAILMRPWQSDDKNLSVNLKGLLLVILSAVILILASYAVDYVSINYADMITKFNVWFEQIIGRDKMFVRLTVLSLIIFMALLIYKTHKRPISLCASLAMLFVVMPLIMGDKSDSVTLYQKRNFFGVTKVKKLPEQQLHQLKHGTTLHGMESFNPEYTAYSYYYLGHDMVAARKKYFSENPYAVMGLGAGTLANLATSGQELDIFEIDPDMIKIAENPKFFTYLSNSLAKYNIHVGDARIEMQKIPDKKYGMIFVDVFSSDSIPMHLMTKEAMSVYVSKLKDDGVMAIHVSSRSLNLVPIVANIVDELNLTGYSIGRVADKKDSKKYDLPSIWVVIGKNEESLVEITKSSDEWMPLSPDGDTPWSDDYSNIIEAILKKFSADDDPWSF